MNVETKLVTMFSKLTITTNVNNPSKKSWALMAIEEEEEDQRREIEERNIIYQKQLEERRRLYALGKYELEDGEILE